MKRIYPMKPVNLRVVSIEPAPSGFVVLINQKPLKSPLGFDLAAPSSKLAEAIAQEWRAASLRPDPSTLPMTALLATCLDRVAPNRTAIIETLVGFLATDLLCFRTPMPPALNVQQEAVLSPLLKFCAAILGVELATTTDLVPVVHDNAAATALGHAFAKLSDPALTVLQVCAAATGSVLLALLLVRGQVSENDAVAACFLDEDYFEGLADPTHENPDPLQARQRKVLHTEIREAMTFLSLAAFE
jgi:chaperone required for assembly of F1-ATPase